SGGGLSGSPASEVMVSHSLAEYSQLAVPQKSLSVWVPQAAPQSAPASSRGGVRRRLMGNPLLVVSITVVETQNAGPGTLRGLALSSASRPVPEGLAQQARGDHAGRAAFEAGQGSCEHAPLLTRLAAGARTGVVSPRKETAPCCIACPSSCA